ncbi:hypothetical protein QT972_05790 [Microcoleus sp. herbarium7]
MLTAKVIAMLTHQAILNFTITPETSKAEVISLREKKSFLSAECRMPSAECRPMRPSAI